MLATISGDPASGVGVLAALAAGLVSFLSPCVLPLVPGYLSAVVGVAPAELDRSDRRRVLVPSLVFVASFSSIFVLLGVGATLLGTSFTTHRQLLDKLAAGLIIALGAFFVATPFVMALNRDWHVDALLRRAGRGGPHSSPARRSRSPGRRASARRSARSCRRPRCRAPRRTERYCWPSTRPVWRSRSWPPHSRLSG